MIETRTNLDSLDAGKEGYIVSIECEDKALRSHILNMGLTPGVEVKLIKTAPMGDPLEIRVRGYELTIRKSEASKIVIEDIHEAHNCPRRNKEFKKLTIQERVNKQYVRKIHPLKQNSSLHLQAIRIQAKQLFSTSLPVLTSM